MIALAGALGTSGVGAQSASADAAPESGSPSTELDEIVVFAPKLLGPLGIDATSEAGKALARRLSSCPPGSAACMEAAMAAGTAEALRFIAEISHMDRRLDEEAQRLARENPDFAVAIPDYQAAQREYQEARRRR